MTTLDALSVYYAEAIVLDPATTSSRPKSDVLSTDRLVVLGLPVMVLKRLGRSGVSTVGDLLRLTEEDLHCIGGLGKTSINYVTKALRDKGIAVPWPSL